MKNLIKRTLFAFLLGISSTGYSSNQETSLVVENKQTVDILINDSKYTFSTSSADADVIVYSIIGSKVAVAQVKSGVCNSPISLPKGYYIVKIGNTSKKIAVK